MEDSENSVFGAENTSSPAAKAVPRRARTRATKKSAAGDGMSELPSDGGSAPGAEAPAARPMRRPRKAAMGAAAPDDRGGAGGPVAKGEMSEASLTPRVDQAERSERTERPEHRDDLDERSGEANERRASEAPVGDRRSEERPVFQPHARREESREGRPESEVREDTATRAQNGGDGGGEAQTAPGGGATDGGGNADAPSGGGNTGDAEGGVNPAPGGDDAEPWWKRNKGKKKKGKWDRGDRPGGGERGGDRGGERGGRGGERSPLGKSRDRDRDRERPPAQPLPPGMGPSEFGALPDRARFEDLEALDALAEAATAATVAPIELDKLYALKLAELGEFGRGLGLALEGVPGRRQWLEAIFRHAATVGAPLVDQGWIDLTDAGFGFIVHEHVNYRLYPENAYLPVSLTRRYGLKRGHHVVVRVAPPQEGERCPAVIGITSVMDRAPGEIAAVTAFEELEPYYPLQRILLEANEIHKDISMRSVDLLTPVGFGQRGLIVAPPRTGKTVLLQNMANSISENFPDVKLILLLIDERPEEVTDFRRHTKGEVVSSTFDEAPTSHVHAAEMVIEKARRLVELGQHVVILLDSITRLARAYNALASNSGKIMSGGVEATALQRPKRFFGSARNIEGGGSLTILGTALIDTGSRMDEVIFEEFKGTGNMELHLDRGLSDKRIFPAINIDRSGTRKEELIYHPQEMERVYGLRRAMQGLPPVEAMEMFITRLKKTKSNAEFLMSLNR